MCEILLDVRRGGNYTGLDLEANYTDALALYESNRTQSVTDTVTRVLGP